MSLASLRPDVYDTNSRLPKKQGCYCANGFVESALGCTAMCEASYRYLVGLGHAGGEQR